MQHIVPIVLEYVDPRSVIDVGCGLGTWLLEFHRRGVSGMLGIDGDYIDRSLLSIPRDRFRAIDLSEPFKLAETADLAISLEMAQHLPASSAASFVRSLAALAPVILFSAAAPKQGGVHQINEQWPDYWAESFHDWGFAAVDCIRDRIWENEDVAWWYAQNMMFFVDREHLLERPVLAAEGASSQLCRLVDPRSSQGMWETNREKTGDAMLRVTDLGTVIVVDGGRLALDLGAERPVRPFLERNGTYWGPPPDNTTAIEEVRRLRGEGARYVAFTFAAAWWLDHYAGFASWLRAEFRCINDDNLVTVFDLTPGRHGVSKAPVRRASTGQALER